VIKKQEENLSEYVRKHFSECFKLDSFKGWLNQQAKYSVVKPEIHNSNFHNEYGDDVEAIFNRHYTKQKTPVVNSAKKDTLFTASKTSPSSEPSVKQPQNYKKTDIDRVSLTPVVDAEKCELCGKFPVKWQFIQDGEKVKRCGNCIDKLKSAGMKFTTLTELSE